MGRILILVLVVTFIYAVTLAIRRYHRKTIFVITPTYSRPNQKPELVRLCTVLCTARDVHWIVIEDARNKSRALAHFLEDCGLPYTHLNAPTISNTSRIRGSAQRNEALKWLRTNFRQMRKSGVVYFADDDNTYHPKLFDEMRILEKGATWPVGLMADSDWEGCITDPNDRNKISNFWSNYAPYRDFPIDMAAFAVNLNLILEHSSALFDDKAVGVQEGLILTGLGFKSAYELEPKADGCRKVSLFSLSLLPSLAPRPVD
ncbi:galactosylgalactosylxylosylprotein [Echinococcus multilocularis]|uniref:Galactosylgalactosylxylosylprotein 3-beta-glucuronosyltransferase n=2 Tax=Echinococcus multilocularis TaxID=6211 RepID=A0A068XWF5_ECHMU|nr:galactosylgalactosylxylosylprotein [Echinococcus multilocularis]